MQIQNTIIEDNTKLTYVNKHLNSSCIKSCYICNSIVYMSAIQPKNEVVNSSSKPDFYSLSPCQAWPIMPRMK